jgi:hypothetical protein
VGYEPRCARYFNYEGGIKILTYMFNKIINGKEFSADGKLPLFVQFKKERFEGETWQ